MFGWQFVGDPRISPDGKRIVYVRASVDRGRDEYDYDLWIDEGEGRPRALTAGIANDLSPRWSPDGSRLAFVSNRSGKRQVHVFDLRAGEPWQLTTDAEGVQSFSWSPDGQHIAFTSRLPLEGDPGYEGTPAPNPTARRPPSRPARRSLPTGCAIASTARRDSARPSVHISGSWRPTRAPGVRGGASRRATPMTVSPHGRQTAAPSTSARSGATIRTIPMTPRCSRSPCRAAPNRARSPTAAVRMMIPCLHRTAAGSPIRATMRPVPRAVPTSPTCT
ncbi:MAG: hypothetical protein HC872_05950 [Gammaproteobacteria bacterium]|nr:hypothetical protein [Gammaproteobacteria bacterium]